MASMTRSCHVAMVLDWGNKGEVSSAVSRRYDVLASDMTASDKEKTSDM